MELEKRTGGEPTEVVEVYRQGCTGEVVEAYTRPLPQGMMPPSILDRLRAEAAKEQSAESILTDETVLYFQGWVPAEKESAVGAFLTENGCAWETLDPTEEEISEVPVQLKNNWLTKPLNMVTEMYSLPRYDNVDPNPLMAPFFILFYGIMMADMGYGLLMFLAGLLISKK